MNDITDHRKDNTAIPIYDGMTRGHNGNKSPKITTRGWELLVDWKDGSKSWMNLKDLKESSLIEVAEYDVANRIVEEPDFKWWVPHTIRKRNQIISKVKSRYWKTTHKFGIRLPKTTKEALQIEKITGTDFF